MSDQRFYQLTVNFQWVLTDAVNLAHVQPINIVNVCNVALCTTMLNLLKKVLFALGMACII